MEHGSKPDGPTHISLQKPGGQALIMGFQRISGPTATAGLNSGRHRGAMLYIYRTDPNQGFYSDLSVLACKLRAESSNSIFFSVWNDPE
jgi:hypothetical protein